MGSNDAFERANSERYNSMYLFRYSFCSAWNNDVLKYSKELNNEAVQSFLQNLPPFKNNLSTEYGEKFTELLSSDMYDTTHENFFFDGFYFENERCFFKVEDENCDNHWCFISKIEEITCQS